MNTKKYAIVIDISPSEQIGEDPNEIMIMGAVFGLKRADAFEKVGEHSTNPEIRLSLRKWSGSSKKYKRNFVEHAKSLLKEDTIIIGAEITNTSTIEETGKNVLKIAFGQLPKISSYNKKGLPRVMLPAITWGHLNFPKQEILHNDLYVLAWYAQGLARIYARLADINKGIDVKIDFLIDNLPNERPDYYKARLLKYFLSIFTNGNATIVGVPLKGDTIQRDLFVDNVAGLKREIVSGRAEKWMSEEEYSTANELYKIGGDVRGRDLTQNDGQP